MTLEELDKEFDAKENWIMEAWKSRSIDREEFTAEMDALGNWYLKHYNILKDDKDA